MKGPEICNERNSICSNIYGSTNDALVARSNLLPAPSSPQNRVGVLSVSCRDSTVCASFYALCKWHTFAHSIQQEYHDIIIIKMDLLDISQIKFNKLQTASKMAASNQ